MRVITYRSMVVGLAVTSCVVAGACAPSGESSAPTFTGPYAAEFEAALNGATDPQIRAVLADGVITRAEYEAANQRYAACAADHGVKLDLVDQAGLYAYSFENRPGADEAVASCDYLAEDISALYAATTRNPDNEDMMDLIAACLVRMGIVGPDYTGEQLRADMDGGTHPALTADGSLTPEAQRCHMDPRSG